MKREQPRARIKRRVNEMVAFVVVGSIYSVALFVARLRGRPRRPPPGSARRIVVVGTFYNRGWFLSHATPLTRCGIEELVVVADEPQAPVAGVRFLCPFPWAKSVLGRTIAKFVCLLLAGFRRRPDLFMGYHIMPCAVMALVAGRLFGRPVSYQMTGGPTEVVAGGAESENPVLGRLGRRGRRLEGLAIDLIREFDQVVVRGGHARRFLLERGVDGDAISIIPGSVDANVEVGSVRTHDLIFVGRLVELKQPLQFVEIVKAVTRTYPSARAAVVGDGPLLADMRQRAAALGVADRLEFVGKTDAVPDILSRARIFVLTSRTEGLSIAMAEAMMAGVVPVVADVGDLGDLVRDGINGYLVKPNDIDAYAKRAGAILEDPGLWSRLSVTAMASARNHVSLDHVTALWREHLGSLFRGRPADH